MPVSPELAEGLARETVAVYARTEAALLELLAGQLARGLASPDWVAEKLAATRQVLAGARSVVEQAAGESGETVRQAIADAWERGGAAAVADLARLKVPGRPARLDNSRAVDALVRETVGTLAPVHSRILREVMDGYRSVIASVAALTNAGVDTRRRVAQRALDRFAAAGVRGFTDRAGRSWELAAYVEMATRTATGRAAVQGHVERLQATGVALVYVSDAPQECELCRPWEGQVLALDGPPGPRDVRARNVLTGQQDTVRVASTLDGARVRGFQHPNCRHSVSAYLPGATRLPVDTEDPQGDEDRRRLRELERNLRQWKRRAAAAQLDPRSPAARTAGAKVREWQAAIREHVATTSAKRQPERERIDNRVGRPGRIEQEAAAAARGAQAAPAPEPVPDRPALDTLSDDALAELLADPAVADDPDRLAEVIGELERRDAEAPAAEPEPEPIDVAAVMAKPYRDQTDAEREALQEWYAARRRADEEALAARLTTEQAHPERRRQSTAEQERRTDFELWLHGQVLAAEDATRGNLLGPAGKRAGVSAVELFTGSAETAIRYASEELIAWWQADPSRRMGYLQWRAQATGSSSRAARRSRDTWLKALSRWEDVRRGRR